MLRTPRGRRAAAALAVRDVGAPLTGPKLTTLPPTYEVALGVADYGWRLETRLPTNSDDFRAAIRPAFCRL